MKQFRFQPRLRQLLAASALMCLMLSAAQAKHGDPHTSTQFQGKVVNGGSVTHVKENGKSILRLSADFQIPGSPDPHWQVIDSKGKSHLLQALKVKEGLSNREVVLPEHVPNVARVQIWCAFAEVILGEASFDQPIK